MRSSLALDAEFSGLNATRELQQLEQQTIAAPSTHFGNDTRISRGFSSEHWQLTPDTEDLQPSPRQQEGSTATGIYDAFVNTCQRWHLGSDEQAVLIGREPNDLLAKCVLDGQVVPWTRDIEERAGYVVAISLGLGALFDEHIEAERAWLNQPRTRFSDRTALEFMLEGSMINLWQVADLVAEERGL